MITWDFLHHEVIGSPCSSLTNAFDGLRHTNAYRLLLRLAAAQRPHEIAESRRLRKSATSGQAPRFLTLAYGPQLFGRRKGPNGIAHGH